MSRIYQNKPQTTTTAPTVAPSSKSPSPAPVQNTTPTAAAAAVVYNSGDHHQHTTADPKQLERMEKLVNRLETIAARLENAAHTPAPVAAAHHVAPIAAAPTPVEVDIPSINAFDDLLNGALKAFVDFSNQIGGDVKTISDLVQKSFNLERGFLVQSTCSAQPSNDLLMKALEPISKVIGDIQAFREKNRKSDFFNHLSAISESIGALGWVTVTPAPSPYVKEMNDAGQFYTNRVLKDFKEKDSQKIHSGWVQSWIKILNELQAYVKEYHTRGVSWNPKGGQLDPNKVSSSSSSSAAAPSAGGPPPPPPPPMFDFPHLDKEVGAPFHDDDLQARLQKELNIGTDITKRLKKVTDDQKTHKNTALRAGNTVPATLSNKPNQEQSQPAAQVTRPPRFELVDKRWNVEYQIKQRLTIDNAELKHTVYIFKCKDTTIEVKTKVNSIILDTCDGVGVLFDGVLATIEFVNSKNVSAQVLGKVPTILIDKTDGCQVYLSKESLDVEIVTAKSSAMNVLVPTNTEGDFNELPLPEQYKTKIVNNKLNTVPTETA